MTNEELTIRLKSLPVWRATHKYVTVLPSGDPVEVLALRQGTIYEGSAPDYDDYLLFIVNGAKAGGILFMGGDLHWTTFKEFRKKKILSSVARAGFIRTHWSGLCGITFTGSHPKASAAVARIAKLIDDDGNFIPLSADEAEACRRESEKHRIPVDVDRKAERAEDYFVCYLKDELERTFGAMHKDGAIRHMFDLRDELGWELDELNES